MVSSSHIFDRKKNQWMTQWTNKIPQTHQINMYSYRFGHCNYNLVCFVHMDRWWEWKRQSTKQRWERWRRWWCWWWGKGRCVWCGMVYNLNAELNSHRGIVSNHSNKHIHRRTETYNLFLSDFSRLPNRIYADRMLFTFLKYSAEKYLHGPKRKKINRRGKFYIYAMLFLSSSSYHIILYCVYWPTHLYVCLCVWIILCGWFRLHL